MVEGGPKKRKGVTEKKRIEITTNRWRERDMGDSSTIGDLKSIAS